MKKRTDQNDATGDPAVKAMDESGLRQGDVYALSLHDLFQDGRAIDEALREAARDARRLHKALGNPMATWKDGQVVWIQPEDIEIDDDPEEESGPAE